MVKSKTNSTAVNLAKVMKLWQADPMFYLKTQLGLTEDKIWKLQKDLVQACLIAIKEHKPIFVGSGHCFAKGTTILMFDGSVKAVEDINVGDKIMGDDSQERNVVSLSRGKEQMYKVEYYDGTQYVHNGSHILSLVGMSNHGKMKRDAIVDISINDFLNLGSHQRRRYTGYRVGVEYSDKEQDIPPYLLGAWLGDGCHCNADFASVDKEIIDVLYNYSLSLGCKLNKNKNGRNLYIAKKRGKFNPFISLLRKNNLFRNKHIPKNYLCGSRAQRLELLAGLIDTDGSMVDGGGYEITQKRKELAEQIVVLARSLGMHTKITPRNISTHFKSGHFKEGIYWRVYIGKGISVPTLLKRKRADVDKGKKHLNRTAIRKIVSLGVGDYYGFSIDGNQRFLGADFMVLHNSLGKDYICSAIALWFLESFSPSKVILTSPSDRQVKMIMWGETLNKWNMRKVQLPGKAFANPYIERRKEDWFLLGFATKDTGASAEASGGKFQGFHSQSLCTIVSEAQAVEDSIFDQIDAIATAENSLIIYIGNPTRAKGRFAAGLKNKTDNIVFNFSCLENPNYLERRIVIPGLATYEWVEDKRKRWGEDDPRWIGRVLGQIPEQGTNVTFPDWLINHMKSRDGMLASASECAGVAVDPAGEGVDDNEFMAGKGGDILATFSKTLMSPSDNAHKAVEMCKQIEGDFIVVDCDGLGIGTYQELKKFDDSYLQGIQIIKFHGSGASEVKDQDRPIYQNMRSEASFVTQARAKAGKAGISSKHTEAIEDLQEEEYFTNKRGLIQIEPKEDIKERLGRSPGKGDAYKMLQWGFSKNFKRRSVFVNRLTASQISQSAVSEYSVLDY